MCGFGYRCICLSVCLSVFLSVFSLVGSYSAETVYDIGQYEVQWPSYSPGPLSSPLLYIIPLCLYLCVALCVILLSPSYCPPSPSPSHCPTSSSSHSPTPSHSSLPLMPLSLSLSLWFHRLATGRTLDPNSCSRSTGISAT